MDSGSNGLEIAIVGMAVRVPGARTPDEFWDNLETGVESIRRFGHDELLEAGVDPSLLNRADYVKANGVLEGIDLFDADFFGYSPREASLTDPQQRLFLEAAWHAFEDSGHDPAAYPGPVGIYAGGSLSTYLLRNLGGSLEHGSTTLPRLLGNDKDHIATRTAYKLGLQGPAVGVQTACSTALVAVHLAVQALLGGECDMALAGGVSVTVPQISGYLYEEGGIYSPDGRCRAFDAGASGTVGGSGVAVFVLKRLSTAIRDRDPVRAVVRGSAVNNDGSRKLGFTAPSPDAQATVIASAQRVAGVAPDTIGFVEAHGTGTPLGDAVEVAALTRAFRRGTSRSGYCALGSVKTNIGHLDAAAGGAGLAKAVLALQRQRIPPTLHFREPDPELGLETSPFFVNREVEKWGDGRAPRRAGVSSFGMGGTNVHVVLEEATVPRPGSGHRTHRLLVVSARTGVSASAAAASLATHLRRHPSTRLGDVAYTLQDGRRHFDHRRFVLAASLPEAIEALQAVARGGEHAARNAAEHVPVTFVFPGQGDLAPAAAAELYEGQPCFREAVESCLASLDERTSRKIRGVLLGPGRPDEAAETAAVVQPATFLLGWALACLWRKWVAEPASTIGHSIGEYAAACVSGVLSPEAAISLLAARGRLVDGLPPGAMSVVALPEVELAAMLADEVSLAAVNAPDRCTIAGPPEAVAETERRLSEAGKAWRRLPVSRAFHSPVMDDVVEPFRRLVADVELRPPEIPLVSTRTGTRVTDDEVTAPDHWARHLREPVRFVDAVGALLEDSGRAFVELGPGRTLTTLIRRHPLRRKGHVVVAPLASGEGGSAVADSLRSLGRLWEAGVGVDWRELGSHQDAQRISLPGYAFRRRRHWVDESRPTADRGAAVEDVDREREPDLGRWFWVPCWKRGAPARVGSPNAEAATGFLHVILGDGALASRLAATLRSPGVDVIQVVDGGTWRGIEADRATIDATRSSHYDRLVDALLERGSARLRIVHAWSTDSTTRSPAAPRDLPTRDAATERSFYGLLFLAQSLSRRECAEDTEIVVVTRGVHEVTGVEELDPRGGALPGVGRSLPHELPGLRVRTIDLDDTDGQVDALADELLAGGRASCVALRGGHRWLRHFERLVLPPREGVPRRLRQDGRYLITGGLGGIGLEVAELLVRCVRARLVLLGRSGLPPEARWDGIVAAGEDEELVAAIERVRRLEALGGEVAVVEGDVTEKRQMGRALGVADRRFGGLDGVVHAAGAETRSRRLDELDREECERVLQAKVRGIEILADLLQDRSLDFVLVQSSLASLLGAGGYAAYAGAHSYMDAFVHWMRRHRDPAWTTIDWDNWYTWKTAPTGLRHGRGQFMSPQEGIEACRRILFLDRSSRIAVSTQDLDRRHARWVEAPADARQGPATGPTSAAAGEGRPSSPAGPEAVPDGEVEGVLAGVWAEVLGVDGVGRHESYFDLGGDSVTALQIVSAARDAGYELSLEEVFEYPTLAELAPRARPVARPPRTSGPVSGEVPLSPLQRWFFAQGRPRPEHFNLSVLVELRERLDPETLRAALGRLIERHDALRLRFPDPGSGRGLIVPATPHEVPLQTVDLGGKSGDVDDSIRRRVAEARRAFDLSRGPLFQALLFDTGGGRPQRLALVAHHLVVDARSWGVLLADLEALCPGGGQKASGAEVVDPPGPLASYGAWLGWFAEQARAARFRDEEEFWAEQLEPTAPLPRDREGANREGSARHVRRILDAPHTRLLVQELRHARKVHPRELLLAALARTLCRWLDVDAVTVDLEDDGRAAADLDLSRTAGWFTSIHPLRLESPQDAAAVGNVKESLQRVPGRGVGYGVLRFGVGASEGAASVAAGRAPEVSFAYLGGLAESAGTPRLFRPVEADLGPLAAAEQPRSHVLQVMCSVWQERLVTEWVYSAELHRSTTIEKLAADFDGEVRALALHCRAEEQAVYAASDFPGSGLSSEELRQLVARLEEAEDRETRE